MRSVRIPCRSRETTMGISWPRIFRDSARRWPSTSSSFSATMAPCIEKKAPSARGAALSAPRNSRSMRPKSAAARGPPHVIMAALYVGSRLISGRVSNTRKAPPISFPTSRWHLSMSSPKRTVKSSYRLGTGLKEEISCLHSAMITLGMRGLYGLDDSDVFPHPKRCVADIASCLGRVSKPVARSTTKGLQPPGQFTCLPLQLAPGVDSSDSRLYLPGQIMLPAKAKWAAVAAGAWLIIAPPIRAAEDPAEFFEMKVRPLLARNCYACHTTSRMSGLQLDSRENVLKGGSRGPAVVPGNPEESLLIQATSYSHEKLRMPPSGRLKAEEIDILKTWIKDGAVWSADPSVKPIRKSEPYVITAEQRKFWSFQPVVQPAVPVVKNQDWPRNAIDRFVLARLEDSGIKPVEPADKRTLIRRATFDLIGLPPSPEEIDAFVSDTSPDAFAKVVDRLLASPHYGERWARYWLDLARYSDGKLGATRDDPYPNAFRYRDWVIEAFNQDLPYDVFLKAQIAADLLDTPDRDRLLPGLGFPALGQ